MFNVDGNFEVKYCQSYCILISFLPRDIVRIILSRFLDVCFYVPDLLSASWFYKSDAPLISASDTGLIMLDEGQNQAINRELSLKYGETCYWEIQLGSEQQYFSIGVGRHMNTRKKWKSYGFDKEGWGFCYHPPYDVIYCCHDDGKLPANHLGHKCQKQKLKLRVGIQFKPALGELSLFLDGEHVCTHPSQIKGTVYPTIVTPNSPMEFQIPDLAVTRKLAFR